MLRRSPRQALAPVTAPARYSPRVTKLAEALASLEARYGIRGLIVPTIAIRDTLDAAAALERRRRPIVH